MPAYDITERVISYLGIPAGVTSTWTNSDYQYDYAIAGVPFLSAINDKSVYTRAPYKRSFVQVRKDQVDQQSNPGEQSLSGWWLRSQQNFTGGAGIKYFEPTNDERTMRRFKDSLGIDCWTTGQISLLNLATAGTVQSGRMWPLSYQSSGDKVAYVYGIGASAVISRQGTTTALTNNGTTLLSVCDDGTNFYRLTNAGMFKGTIASGGESAFFTTTQPTQTTGTVAWVKSRIILASNNVLYELPGSGTTALPATTGATTQLLYTHPNSSWVWASICDGPSAIYAAGYAGSKSVIYKFAPDSSLSGGVLPYMGRGVVVAELPTGEIVNSISTYLGRYMAVCTNKGLRIAIIDGNGDLTYGPLLWTEAACYSAWGGDRFFYVGTTISSGGGLIRVDLSDPDNDGRFPYATDLQSNVASAYVTGICQIGTGSLKAFVAYNGTSSYPVEEGTSKVPSGWLRSGQVRYSTLEPKHFELVKPHWETPIAGSFAVSTIGSDGTENALLTVGSGFVDQDIQVYSTSATVSQGVRFDLTRSAGDVTAGPVVRGWQLKAVPAVTRKQYLEVPLLCFDFQRDRFDAQVGYEGFAIDRLNALLNVVRTGDVVTYQDLSNGEAIQVVLEDYQFEQVSPPGIASGFGGILVVQLREI